MTRRVFMRRTASAGAVLAIRPAASGDPVNIRVSHDDFAVHAETSIAVNPRDPRNLLGLCIVGDAQFHTAAVAGYASFDGGVTWSSNGVLPAIPTTGVDPSVAFDARGAAFVGSLVGSTAQPQGAGAYVWRTDDGGRHFHAPVNAIPGLIDHPSVATGDPDTVYVATSFDPGLAFTRSTDGGRGFEPPCTLDPQGGQPVTTAGPDGVVCIAYPVLIPPLSEGIALLRTVTSTDHGRTFSAPVDLLRTSILPYFNLPSLALSRRTGRLHVVVATYDSTTHRSDTWLFSSTDLGRTWRSPQCLATSDRTIYLQPALAIDETGRLAVTVFADNQGWIDVLLFVSRPGSTRFRSPQRVTTRPFALSLGVHGRWIGDYQGLACTGDTIHPFWNDTRTGNLEIFTATIR
jgi:hypothetical protein